MSDHRASHSLFCLRTFALSKILSAQHQAYKPSYAAAHLFPDDSKRAASLKTASFQMKISDLIPKHIKHYLLIIKQATFEQSMSFR